MGTVSLARIWCFLPFSAMIVRALQERSYEKNRGNYLTYESSLQSYDTHESTYKWLSLIRWLMYAYANEPCPLVICLHVIGQIEKLISIYVMGHMAYLIFFPVGWAGRSTQWVHIVTVIHKPDTPRHYTRWRTLAWCVTCFSSNFHEYS